jgi:hypothetical protein
VHRELPSTFRNAEAGARAAPVPSPPCTSRVLLAVREGEDADEAMSGQDLDIADLLSGALSDEETSPEEMSLAEDASEPPHADLANLQWDFGDLAADTEAHGAVLELELGSLVTSLPDLTSDSEAPAIGLENIGVLVSEDFGILAEDDGAEFTLDHFVHLPRAADEAFEAGEDEQAGSTAQLDALEAVLAFEEDGVPAAPVAWRWAKVYAGALGDIALHDDHLIGAGAALVGFPRARDAAAAHVTRVAAPHAIVNVAPWQEEQLLCATAVGVVYTYDARAGFQPLAELQRRFGAPEVAVDWRLSGVSCGGENCVALLSSNGRVVLAGPDGRLRPQLWRGLVLGRGAPLPLVSLSAGRPFLRTLEDPLGKWSDRPLGTASAWPGVERDSLLCCHGERVALAHPRSGLWLSSDSGRSFAKIAGCSSTSALTFAALGSRLCLFAATSTLEPALGVVLLDVLSGRAERIAEIDLGQSAADGDDWAARALVWDPRACVLWVAGGFGLIRLEQPSRPD